MAVSRRIWKALAIVGGVATVAILAAVGIVFVWFDNLGPPDLLDDARWNDPASTVKFRDRFQGREESALLDWLEDDDFRVDRAGRSASRTYDGFPCAEGVDVVWRVNANGLIEAASATVHEAGCL